MHINEYKILLVDDEKTLREMVCGFLQRAGFYKVIIAADCRQARELFHKEAPQLVLLDVMLPDGDGFSLFEELQKIRKYRSSFFRHGMKMRTGCGA